MIMHVSRLTPACQGLFNVIIINSIFDPSVCLPYLSGGSGGGGIYADWRWGLTWAHGVSWEGRIWLAIQRLGALYHGGGRQNGTLSVWKRREPTQEWNIPNSVLGPNWMLKMEENCWFWKLDVKGNWRNGEKERRVDTGRGFDTNEKGICVKKKGVREE